jgi:hypothetical protein
MEVVIISAKKQSFNGFNYWKDKSTGYYKNAQLKPHSLHRQVWIYHNGDIPKGCVIDHIDRNKDNNQIDNLRLVSSSENNRNVAQSTIDKRREWASKIRPLAKEWHKSDEGREWHRKHGIEAYKKRRPIVKICAHCGKEYSTTKYSTTARFCSSNCKMKARTRRLRGLPENFSF